MRFHSHAVPRVTNSQRQKEEGWGPGLGGGLGSERLTGAEFQFCGTEGGLGMDGGHGDTVT